VTPASRRGKDSRVGRTEREVGVNLNQLGHPLVVDQLKIDDCDERLLHDRPKERGLDLRATRAADQITDLGNRRRRHEDRAPGTMQTGQQVRAGAEVLVVAIGRRDQRTDAANGHSGTPEAFGEQILVIAAEVETTAGERPELRRRPLTHRHLPALPTSLSKNGWHAVVG
jgi:hypothetical protein